MKAKQKGYRSLFNTISEAFGSSDLTCSQWAEFHRKIGGKNWSFERYPWMRDLHDCDDELFVVRKAAQQGYSECLLNKAFYCNAVTRKSVLYVLPSAMSDAADFSKSRFNPAIAESPMLRGLYTDVDNVSLKRAGACNFYIRGSRVPSQLKSISVSLVILDEYEEMNHAAVAMVRERLSAQDKGQIIYVSNPTISGINISEMFDRSTQEHFHFRCPSCNEFEFLEFPRSLVFQEDKPKEAYLQCCRCKAHLPNESKAEWLSKGVWVAKNPTASFRGQTINHLYSLAGVTTPSSIAVEWVESQKHPARLQNFYNNKMGLPYKMEGASVSETDVVNCIDPSEPSSNLMVCMGVDVGSLFHYEVTGYNEEGQAFVLDYGCDKSEAVIYEKMEQYQPVKCVIDSRPETRIATQFAKAFPGIVYLCQYLQASHAELRVHHDNAVPIVSVDRTSFLDSALMRFRKGTIHISSVLPSLNEYKNQLTAPVRVYEADPRGQMKAVYRHTRDDHFAHARCYSEVAYELAHKRCSFEAFSEKITW